MDPNTTGRQLLVIASVCASLLLMLLLPPIAQDPAYHGFADARTYLGIPNFLNIVSNIFFLFVGVAGVRFCLSAELGQARLAWLIFFCGVTLVSVGSSYYHWQPDNTTLVWDRIPMTIAFMALFVALLSEYISLRLAPWLLAPALLLGLASVLYWVWQQDLRFYVWVQFFPLLTIPLVMWLFTSHYTRQWLLLAALSWYVVAKLFEMADRSVFELTSGLVGGHSLKHILAAAGCLAILRMLQTRKVHGTPN